MRVTFVIRHKAVVSGTSLGLSEHWEQMETLCSSRARMQTVQGLADLLSQKPSMEAVDIPTV